MAAPNHAAPGARRVGGSNDHRQTNLAHILRYVSDHGPSSRHDIAHACGLGISTMTDLVTELRSRRLVKELKPVRRPGAGRPTRPLAIDGDPWVLLGVQVQTGQVHFAAETLGGRKLWQTTVPVQPARDGQGVPTSVLEDLFLRQVERVPASVQLIAAAIGVPDRVDPAGSALLGRSPEPESALATQLAGVLQRHGLPRAHVEVATDAHLAALYATRVELNLPSESVAVYLGGSEQIRSGLVVNGRIFLGSKGGAGEVAHANVDPAGPQDDCGRAGCLQSLAGPVSLLVHGGILSRSEAEALVQTRPQEVVDRINAAVQAGDAEMVAALERAGDALGSVIDDISGTLNPDAVALGGYLGRLGEHLKEPVRRRLQSRRLVEAFADTRVLWLAHPVPRVVRGALLAARDAGLDHPLNLTSPLEL